MRVWLDPFKLLKYQLTPSDVTSAIQAQNTQVSVGSLGAQPTIPGQQINVTITAQSQLTTVADFEHIILKVEKDGATVRLSDVSRIEIGQESYGGSSRYNGQPSTGFAVNLAIGANAIDTAARVRSALEVIGRGLPAGVEITYPYDTTPFVELSIEKVVHTLIEAIVLVFVVLLVFLQNLRATLIPTIAVPVVLLGTFGVLAVTGYSINTLTMFAMAKNVAGDAAIVESITKPGAEIHNYAPTPGDIQRAQGAQLILWNGLNLERWFEKFFQNLHDVPGAVVSDGIEPLGISEGPYEGKPNPHAWMSPKNALIYVDNIRDAFAKYDPANAETYKANAEAYKQKIEATITPIRATLEKIPEDKRWLVSSEGAFSYLARDFGLKELYLWPINADQQGTPQQVRKVIDAVKENQIPTVFSESTVSDKPARQVARETGAHYGGVLYVDSLSEADGPVPTYIDLLRVTSDTVAKGLADGLSQ